MPKIEGESPHPRTETREKENKMFENEYKLTGRIKYIETKTANNGNMILNAQLSNGNKEKGYNNFKIRAFKEIAEEMAFIEPNTAITCMGWVSQDNWEKDGKKFSQVIFNVKSYEEYISEEQA